MKGEIIMSKGFLFGDELLDKELEDELSEQDFCLNDIDSCPTEIDFYPPSDDRVWTSNVEDIDDGDNFIDYCVEFFEMLDEEEYYDN